MSWFLKGWVMPYDALIPAGNGRLACHEHHQNPSKSLGRHVSVQQECCQCPGSIQAPRRLYSLWIATVLRIKSTAIFFLATTLYIARVEKVGSLSWLKQSWSLAEDCFSGALEKLTNSPLGNLFGTWCCLELGRSRVQGPSCYFIYFIISSMWVI